jgi:hypothetical protein
MFVNMVQRLLEQARRAGLRPVLYRFALGDEIHAIAVKVEE